MDKISEVIKKQKKFAIFPIVCADHCAQLLGIKFSEVAYDGSTLAKVLEFGHGLYKYDMILVFSDAYVEAQALGCPVKLDPFPTQTGPRSDQHTDRTEEIIKAARILKTKVKVPIFVSIKGPFSLAAFLLGIKDFLKMVLKNEKGTENIINEALQFQIEYIEKLLTLNVNIFIGDPVASTSLISPEVFEKFAYGPLKTLINKVKAKELLTGIHICGDTEPIIQLLDTIGTDILSIEDITLKTKTLKMGGVSTSTILYGKPSQIEEEIKAALKQPNLILSTSCDVPIATDPENIKAMMKIANEYSND